MINDFIKSYPEGKLINSKQANFILDLCLEKIDFSDPMVFRGDYNQDFVNIYLDALADLANQYAEESAFKDNWEQIKSQPISNYKYSVTRGTGGDFGLLMINHPELKDESIKKIEFSSHDWAELAKAAMRSTYVFGNRFDMREQALYYQFVDRLVELFRTILHANEKILKEELAEAKAIGKAKGQKVSRGMTTYQATGKIFAGRDDVTKAANILTQLLSGLWGIGEEHSAQAILKFLRMGAKTLEHSPEDDTQASYWKVAVIFSRVFISPLHLQDKLIATDKKKDTALHKRYETTFFNYFIQCCLQSLLATDPRNTSYAEFMSISTKLELNHKLEQLINDITIGVDAIDLSSGKVKSPASKNTLVTIALDYEEDRNYFIKSSHHSTTLSANSARYVKTAHGHDLPRMTGGPILNSHEISTKKPGKALSDKTKPGQTQQARTISDEETSSYELDAPKSKSKVKHVRTNSDTELATPVVRRKHGKAQKNKH